MDICNTTHFKQPNTPYDLSGSVAFIMVKYYVFL